MNAKVTLMALKRLLQEQELLLKSVMGYRETSLSVRSDAELNAKVRTSDALARRKCPMNHN
jgi:hypothetical protein